MTDLFEKITFYGLIVFFAFLLYVWASKPLPLQEVPVKSARDVQDCIKQGGTYSFWTEGAQAFARCSIASKVIDL